MRRIRCSVAVLCWVVVVGLAPGAVQAQSKGLPAPSALLAFRPTLPGVDHDTPTDQKAIDACKVELVTVQNRSIGYALRDGQGKMLRRYVATRGGKMDQWSYYQDGFEVYREVDLDGDQALDEARWMNAGGMRVATVKKGKIVGWRQISAEEASKVFVQGLVQAMASGDASLLETVMATPDELAAAGLPREVVDKVGRGRRGPRREGRRPAQVADRLDATDGLEPVRRHLSARDPRRSGRWAREGRARL